MRIAQQSQRAPGAPAHPPPRAAWRLVRFRCGCRGGRCACPPPSCFRRKPRSARRSQSCVRRPAASPAPPARGAPRRHASRSAGATAPRRCAPCPATVRSSGCASRPHRRRGRTIASGVGGFGEQRLGGAVDRDVGRLGGQHHRDQQRKGIGEVSSLCGSGVTLASASRNPRTSAQRHRPRFAAPWPGGRVLPAWQRLSRSHGPPGKGLQRRLDALHWEMEREAEQARGGTVFEAVIIPHRSLSPRGLRILIAVICLLCGLTVLRFWLHRRLAGGSVQRVGDRHRGLPAAAQRERARASELVLLSEEAAHCAHRPDGPAAGTYAAGRLGSTWCWKSRPGRVPKLVAGRARGAARRSPRRWARRRSATWRPRLATHCIRRAIPRFDNPQLRGDPESANP